MPRKKNGIWSFDVLLAIVVVKILVSCFVDTCYGTCNQVDIDSLSNFNLSISAGSSPLNWSLSVDCCSWEGVGCDNSGRVVSLWLPSRGMSGSISPYIRNLTALYRLGLSQNAFSGSLPDGFFKSFNTLQVLDLSGNRFSGEISGEDAVPGTVQTFKISSNQLVGTIPASFLQAAFSLVDFNVSDNGFHGSIPVSICSFSPSIWKLDFSRNDFSGTINQGLGNCSNLKVLHLGFNNLSGTIPPDLYALQALEELYLPGNMLAGPIDDQIVNVTSLKVLVLFGNNFTGTIPRGIGKLSNLEHLQLHINGLTGTIPPSVSNCTHLIILNLRVNFLEGELASFDFSNFFQLRSVDLGNNFFTGGLPRSLFTCKTLTAIRLAVNKLSGEIPPDIRALQSLSFLSISNNSLTNISSAITILAGCKNLSVLIISKNFNGEKLPESESLIGPDDFRNIRVMALGACNFQGIIPTWLSKLSNLEVLDLSVNSITGTIPGWMGAFLNLFYLDLTNNLLSGGFPLELVSLRRLAIQKNSDKVDSSYLELPVFVDANNITSLQYNQVTNLPPAIYFGNNSLEGAIPEEIGQLKFLLMLDLSGNNFSGSIPSTLANLTSLEMLDLSRNNLSGEIPASLINLNFLSSFSVANNNLQGPIPTGGQFNTFSVTSFAGNPSLCGQIINQSCSKDSSFTSQSTHSKGIRKKTIVILSVAICSSIFVLTVLGYCIFSRKVLQRRDAERGYPDTFNSSEVVPEDTYDTSQVIIFPNNIIKPGSLTIVDILKATENFNQSNIIGCGGFGLVYKATLSNGTRLAIKKLSGDLGLMEREFQAEVEALSTAQHKNLVTLQGYCIHDGIRFLLYSYMENGSLDSWLHEKPDGPSLLSWPARLRIVQGVSYGLAYMHQVCEPRIVHRDIKSSNILLDQNFEARVADFGLARLMLPCHTHVTTEFVGTLGYIPPEYNQSWMATLRGDIYSFGVVMLELLTGRRPVELFKENAPRELVKWVHQMRSEGKQNEVFDPYLRGKGLEEEMMKMLEVACFCVDQNPFGRPSIQEVVERLDSVRAAQQGSM